MSITLTLSPKEIQRLYESWKEYQNPKTPAYALWCLKPENCTITAFATGKVVFQGKDEAVYASAFGWVKQVEPLSLPLDDTKAPSVTYPQAGSDEVGTGDYFGPICVCATYVSEKDVPFLQKLGVQDSKAILDTTIRKIAPSIMKRCPYSLLILSNKKYNEIHGNQNINAIKAKLHNQSYVNLAKKVPLPALCVVDQFVGPIAYYRYLAQEKTVIHTLHFETKAENKYLAVACGSIIARYAFLVEWDKMEKKYGMALTKGAGAQVDEDAQAFVHKFGKEKLGEVAKLHFSNTQRIL